MSEVATHTIERIHAPSREEFDRIYLDHRKPVIITGVVDQWPAFTKWTPEFLRDKAPDAKVSVRCDETGDHFNYYTPQGGINKEMTFGPFIEGLIADPPERRFYLSEQALKDVSPDLLEDIESTRYMDWSHPVFFIGNGTYTPNHYHGNHEAFLCQISGPKVVQMYPPEQTRCFYAYPWYTTLLNFARVDERNPDLKKFPRFKNATPIEVHLEPGEMLFIPIHWWHSVHAPDLGVSVTFFWPAKRKSYRFPFPALQVYAHHWLSPASLAGHWTKVRRKLLRR